VARLLATRPWPGNVRQLLNVIRNIVVLHDGLTVQPSMLPAEITPFEGAVNHRAGPQPVPAAPPVEATRDRISALVGTPLADVERELIEATIAYCAGSIPRAARMLELSPSTIYRKLETWTGAQRRA
jgi:DNA-binding NtrC family response regulator